MQYNIGDKIISKKNHPCGGNVWTIIRTGCDIKIKCDKCGHTIMIGLDKFPSIIKSYLPNRDKND